MLIEDELIDSNVSVIVDGNIEKIDVGLTNFIYFDGHIDNTIMNLQFNGNIDNADSASMFDVLDHNAATAWMTDSHVNVEVNGDVYLTNNGETLFFLNFATQYAAGNKSDNNRVSIKTKDLYIQGNGLVTN